MKKHKVIGIMSGTSLDGLDLAYCHLWKVDTTWKFDIVATKSIAYTSELRQQLKNAIYLTAQELLSLNNTYGKWLGAQTKLFIDKNQLDVDFIASHGHTTHHRPEKEYTYQVGSGQQIANICGLKVLCDFRTNDVCLGGQGAPLVPIGDHLLFGTYDFCLNLGGISNVSFVHNDDRIAYDIGLANMILNHITEKIDLPYDNGGQLARGGNLNSELLKKLNGLEYYKRPFPKSIGYEWFVAEVVPIIETTNDSIENLLHTSVVHICEQIALQLKMYRTNGKKKMLVTGGGALNQFLIDTLENMLKNELSIHIPSNTIIEFKEALVFALMGVLRSEGAINVLSSVTGAEKDSSSGVLYLPA